MLLLGVVCDIKYKLFTEAYIGSLIVQSLKKVIGEKQIQIQLQLIIVVLI